MVARLEELNRDLAESANQPFPEDFVKKTLLAHGFLAHQQMMEEHRRKMKEAKMAASECPTSSREEKGFEITDEEKKRTTQLIYHFKEGREFHSLKEPISLVRYQRPTKSQTLWPAEVNCVTHRYNFLLDIPSHPEPLYVPDSCIIPPKMRSPLGEGHIVYSNLPGPEKYFTKARPGPNISAPHHKQRENGNTSLIFESKFESGNLAKAIQVGRWDYELYLRFDLYTRKHTQWFYFSVQNMRAGQTYRFTIVNLYKPSSLYNDGMQPLFYSERKAELYKIGWRRVGFNIKYFKTDIRRIDTNSEQYYYGLTWSYTFQMDNDVCYFSHCYPYTYTDLQEYLSSISSDPIKSVICKQKTLCHTVAGNPVPILTITSPSATPEEAQGKKAVVVTARVHPGETNSSWMMKGLIDLLTSQSPDAEILRDAFVFKVIPMLNPDGVIIGNYRCSLTGRDLNRNYRTKLREAYPTVWHAKQFIKKLSEERKIVVYCDLHGHSRKQNVFIYGCDNVQDPSMRLQSRVFPIMLSRNAPTKFTYDSCNFKVQRTKEGTGRVFMWKEMGILNSYTMEATFCGSTLGKDGGYHFNVKDLESMGYHFCDTLLDYCDPDQTKVEKILSELTQDYRNQLLSKLTALGVEIPPGVDPLDVKFDSDFYSELESSDAGSDSSESDGPPVHLLKKKKQKKLQSRRERNRQKARIKLTHKLSQHSSPNQQTDQSLPGAASRPKKGLAADQAMPNGIIKVPAPPIPPPTSTESGPTVQPSASNSSLNGGIPKFVLERIEEKSKKEQRITTNEELLPQYITSVTADFMKHGLPLNSTLDTNKELVASTASLLSQQTTNCPIAITPKILQQPSQSKLSSSRPQLPQLPAVMPSGSSSGGAFARNYVVHHLQEETQLDTNWTHESTTSGNMRNLVSLSKLFRQLKPHLIGTPQRELMTTTSQSSVTTGDTLRGNETRPPLVEPEQKKTKSLPLVDNKNACNSRANESQKTSLTGLKTGAQLEGGEEEINNPWSYRGGGGEGGGVEGGGLAQMEFSSESMLQLMQPPVTALELFDNMSTMDTPHYMDTHDTHRMDTHRMDTQRGFPSSESGRLEKRDQSLHTIPLTHRKTNSTSDGASNSSIYNSTVLSHMTGDYSTSPSSFRRNANESHKTDHSSDSGGLTYRKSMHKSHIAKAVQNFHHQRKSLSKLSTDQSRPQTSANIPFAHEMNSFIKPRVREKRIQSGNGGRGRGGGGERKTKTNSSNRPTSTTATSGVQTRLRTHSSKHSSRNTTHGDNLPLVEHETADGGAGGGTSSTKVFPSTVSIMLSSSSASRPTSRQHQPKPLQLRYYSNYKRGLF